MIQVGSTPVAILLAFLGAGAGAFAIGIAKEPDRVWAIFLVNFLFWSGVSQSGAVFLAILQVAKAKWAGPLKAMAASVGGFLPLSFVLYFFLYLGRESLFPWIGDPVAEKAAWLNAPFLFARDGIGLALLIGMSLALILSREGKGQIFSSSFLLLYALVYSLIGFDLVMSLDPHWYSTLFGAYFFMSSLYLGLAALAVVSVVAQKYLGLEVASGHFHDLGKLLFAFCMLTGDFLWSQFAVIWYGNIPEETEYVILRTMEMPWAPLAWAVLVGSFIIPFFFLLSRGVKENPRTLLSVAAIILIGMWFERYLLVVPSLWHKGELPLGWLELFVTLGFFAAFALSSLFFGRLTGSFSRGK